MGKIVGMTHTKRSFSVHGTVTSIGGIVIPEVEVEPEPVIDTEAAEPVIPEPEPKVEVEPEVKTKGAKK